MSRIYSQLNPPKRKVPTGHARTEERRAHHRQKPTYGQRHAKRRRGQRVTQVFR